MSNDKVQMSNQAQMYKIINILAFGFWNSFGICHLDFEL